MKQQEKPVHALSRSLNPRLTFPSVQVPGLGFLSKTNWASKSLLCIGLLDVLQILVLSFVPSPDPASVSPSVVAVIPPLSVGFFLHVFLGNALWGAQELIPVYSVYAFARNLYLLLPTMTLLGTTWHLSQAGVVLKLLAFAYSWLEISAYSYATFQSCVFIWRIKSGLLTGKYVLKSCVITVTGLALAAAMEVMAVNAL